MRARDLTGETMLSLTANTARSLLTILGIVIGIVSVIVMISIGDATKASITGELSSVGSNLIMVTPTVRCARRQGPHAFRRRGDRHECPEWLPSPPCPWGSTP